MMFRCRFISFILFLAITSLGYNMTNKGAIINKGINKGEQMLVRKLDAILLTTDDLPATMELDISSSSTIPGFAKQPPVVDGFSQSWNGTQPEEPIHVSYWLFQSGTDAEKAAYQWCGSHCFSRYPSTRAQCRGCHRRCHIAHPRVRIPVVREKQCPRLHHGKKTLYQSTDMDENCRPKN